MRIRTAVLLALALSALAPFAEEPDAQIRALVTALGADEVEVRESAERDLLALGEPARERLQAEMENASDPEIRSRLGRVLRRLDIPKWKDSLAEALQAAKARGKLVIVVQVGANEARGFGSFMQMTTELESVTQSLSGCELVWEGPSKPGAEGQPAMPRDTFEASMDRFDGHQGLRDIRIWFLTSEGKVRHMLQGWWGEARLNAEIARARDFLALPVTEVRERRAAIIDELNAEFAASSCGNARRHLGPWQCSAVGCVSQRLSMIYAAGSELLDRDVTEGFPEPWAPGTGPAAIRRR
ncbi:MAG: hypothetical protein HUU15_06550 [Candidatus Brocadiae bacterium]|nr:hypothetical protein [Candidatus Brocadiia bacterium]